MLDDSHFSIYLDESANETLADEYSHYFGLTLKKKNEPIVSDFYLYLNSEGLTLRSVSNSKEMIFIDFLSGKTAHRFQFGTGLSQQIAKAVGISAYKPSILDLTAGFAQDAFVLASLGCEINACEQNPVIAALVFDGIKRGLLGSQNEHLETLHSALNRLNYQFVRAQTYLAQLASKPDVIYLDPMFESGSYAKAQVKKQANALRALASPPLDADELLEMALEQARCRVVVKRPKRGRVLADIQPSYELKGKSNRYDIYALKQVKPL